LQHKGNSLYTHRPAFTDLRRRLRSADPSGRVWLKGLGLLEILRIEMAEDPGGKVSWSDSQIARELRIDRSGLRHILEFLLEADEIERNGRFANAEPDPRAGLTIVDFDELTGLLRAEGPSRETSGGVAAELPGDKHPCHLGSDLQLRRADLQDRQGPQDDSQPTQVGDRATEETGPEPTLRISDDDIYRARGDPAALAVIGSGTAYFLAHYLWPRGGQWEKVSAPSLANLAREEGVDGAVVEEALRQALCQETDGKTGIRDPLAWLRAKLRRLKDEYAARSAAAEEKQLRSEGRRSESLETEGDGAWLGDVLGKGAYR
jgi:hypothetical protein